MLIKILFTYILNYGSDQGRWHDFRSGGHLSSAEAQDSMGAKPPEAESFLDFWMLNLLEYVHASRYFSEYVATF